MYNTTLKFQKEKKFLPLVNQNRTKLLSRIVIILNKTINLKNQLFINKLIKMIKYLNIIKNNKILN